MDRYHIIEVLIKHNLKDVIEGIKDVNMKSAKYTQNPCIISMREVRYAREKLSILIEEAIDKIYSEWMNKYRDSITEHELRSLTQDIMVNLCERQM